MSRFTFAHKRSLGLLLVGWLRSQETWGSPTWGRLPVLVD